MPFLFDYIKKMKLRVATFNILNTSCRYEERMPYIIESISRLNSDIIGLQEVNIEGNSDILKTKGYNVEVVMLPKSHLSSFEPNFCIDGNAILIRKNIDIIEKYELIYSNQLRAALFLKLRIENKEFIFGNTHLDHLTDARSLIQVKELLEFCKRFENIPIIITGGYNFAPYSIPYQTITEKFRSSYKEINKREAPITFPTGLLGKYANMSENGSPDYIWISENISCLNSQVFTNCGEGEVWASDHYPVYSEVEFN